jgi:hypothetical protein
VLRAESLYLQAISVESRRLGLVRLCRNGSAMCRGERPVFDSATFPRVAKGSVYDLKGDNVRGPGKRRFERLG